MNISSVKILRVSIVIREYLFHGLKGEFIQIKDVLVLAYLDRDQFIVQLRQFLVYQQ